MVTVGMLAGLAIALVVVAISVGIGAEILSELRDTQSSTGGADHAYNVSTDGLTAMATFGDWLPLIALVVVASVIIGLVVTYMGKIA